jgi:hypothetical protein
MFVSGVQCSWNRHFVTVYTRYTWVSYFRCETDIYSYRY